MSVVAKKTSHTLTHPHFADFVVELRDGEVLKLRTSKPDSALTPLMLSGVADFEAMIELLQEALKLHNESD